MFLVFSLVPPPFFNVSLRERAHEVGRVDTEVEMIPSNWEELEEGKNNKIYCTGKSLKGKTRSPKKAVINEKKILAIKNC